LGGVDAFRLVHADVAELHFFNVTLYDSLKSQAANVAFTLTAFTLTSITPQALIDIVFQYQASIC
jgi:hypothetical protein